RVIDFSLGVPSPASIANVVRGNSATVQVDVSSLGSFDQTVTFSCDAAAQSNGITCTATPVTLTAGANQQVVVTVNTSITTPAAKTGTPYNITIQATSMLDANHSVQHTQALPVTVFATAGFVIDKSAYTPQIL